MFIWISTNYLKYAWNIIDIKFFNRTAFFLMFTLRDVYIWGLYLYDFNMQ